MQAQRAYERTVADWQSTKGASATPGRGDLAGQQWISNAYLLALASLLLVRLPGRRVRRTEREAAGMLEAYLAREGGSR